MRLYGMAGRVLVVAAAVVAAALLFGAPAQAGTGEQAGETVQLVLRTGFDGYIQPNTWTPIAVTASNDGPDISGELRVVVDPLTGARTVYRRAIELPRGSRKQVTLYAADISAFGSEVQVDLVQRGRVVTNQRERIYAVNPTTLLIGVWSDNPQGLAALSQVTPSSGEVRVAVLTADDLPGQPQGWQALDVLVMADVDSGQLTPDQQAALRGWLQGGGRLVIAGGVGFQRTLAGLSDVTPVQAAATQTVSLAPLAGLAGAPFGPQARLEAPAASGSLAPDARLLAHSNGVPLLAWRPVGYGSVTYLAPDPNLEPLRSWDGMEALWRAVLSVGVPRPAWAFGFAAQWDYARQAVAAVPGVSLPSVVQLCGFLAVYVVLIGPVNYLVLARLKRRELAWFTIPGLILLFSAIAYVTGFQLRGSRAILHRLALVESSAGSDQARVSALVGVWSPRRARYDIQLEPGYLAHPMPRDLGGVLNAIADTEVDEGTAVTLRNVRVDVGSVQPFVVEGYASPVAHISGELTIQVDAGGVRLIGPVSNAGEVEVRDVALALGGTVIPLGDLPAGQVIQVNEVLTGGQAGRAPGSSLDPFPETTWGYYGGYDAFVSSVAGGDCYETPEQRRRCNLFLSMLNGQGQGTGLTLFGWTDSVPFDMQVLNAGTDVVDTALYAVELQADLLTGAQGFIEVPPGLMTWRLEEDPYGYSTPYDLYLYADQQMTFRYEPSALVPPLEVQSFDVNIEPYNFDPQAQASPFEAADLPLVQVRNIQSGRWDTLALAGFGSTAVQDAGRYVDSSGGVELRLIAPNDSFGMEIDRFDVTLRGRVVSQENP